MLICRPRGIDYAASFLPADIAAAAIIFHLRLRYFHAFEDYIRHGCHYFSRRFSDY